VAVGPQNIEHAIYVCEARLTQVHDRYIMIYHDFFQGLDRVNSHLFSLGGAAPCSFRGTHWDDPAEMTNLNGSGLLSERTVLENGKKGLQRKQLDDFTEFSTMMFRMA
jgi:hypothetical protein